MDISVLNEAKKLNVLCAGESIQDIYRYVQPVGRATKDPIVTWAGNTDQSWAGGVEAVANHLRGIVGDVQVLSNAVPLQKVRYVEQPFGRKVFSVVEETKIGDQSVVWTYDPDPGAVDLVVVTDYGHGFFNPVKKIERCLFLWKQAYGNPFIALNVQANSLNWGMSLITKWSRADYIVCNENELRLALSDATTPVKTLMSQLANKMKARYIAVTLGHEGAAMWSATGIASIAALTPPTKVVDRMGAGDAFLAASAPMLAMGAAPEVALRVGSLAAALSVQSRGNDLQLTASMIMEAHDAAT